jgi:hypothetical protein
VLSRIILIFLLTQLIDYIDFIVIIEKWPVPHQCASPTFKSFHHLAFFPLSLYRKTPSQIKGVAVEAKKMYNLSDGLAPQMMQTMPKIR